MPVLVKCPQVSSKGPSLSGDGEEKGAGKETRPITTDSDWIPQYFIGKTPILVKVPELVQ